MCLKITAQVLYENLKEYFDIHGSSGSISFKLADVTILYDKKDIIGNLIQEWLVAWIKHKSYYVVVNKNTQAFPDIHLDVDNPIKGLLEVKSFDNERSANFDIANFTSYSSSLETMAYRLDADYLIFAYKSNNGNISIENIWLKKVWELCGPSAKWPIKVQEKKNTIYNIRPITWYSDRTTYKPFKNKSEFISAIHETLYKYPATRHSCAHWKDKVYKNYKKWTGREL